MCVCVCVRERERERERESLCMHACVCVCVRALVLSTIIHISSFPLNNYASLCSIKKPAQMTLINKYAPVIKWF